MLVETNLLRVKVSYTFFTRIGMKTQSMYTLITLECMPQPGTY